MTSAAVAALGDSVEGVPPCHSCERAEPVFWTAAGAADRPLMPMCGCAVVVSGGQRNTWSSFSGRRPPLGLSKWQLVMEQVSSDIEVDLAFEAAS